MCIRSQGSICRPPPKTNSRLCQGASALQPSALMWEREQAGQFWVSSLKPVNAVTSEFPCSSGSVSDAPVGCNKQLLPWTVADFHAVLCCFPKSQFVQNQTYSKNAFWPRPSLTALTLPSNYSSSLPNSPPKPCPFPKII